jgi:hypothetical protein
MKIGIDFDNTIVTYDKVFHRHAVRLGLISDDVAMNKREIRDTIRLLPQGAAKWTELQGLVYGLYIAEAEFAPGIERFLRTCKKQSVRTFIVSHKTMFPARGPQYNLRDAAQKWIDQRAEIAQFGFSRDDCFFLSTLAEKLAKVAECGCDYFIDDLVEVLVDPQFPNGVRKVLYSANLYEDIPETISKFSSWDEIHEFVFGA